MKHWDNRFKVFRDIFKNKLSNSMNMHDTNLFIPQHLEKRNKRISKSKNIFHLLKNFFVLIKNFTVIFLVIFFCFCKIFGFSIAINNWLLFYYYILGICLIFFIIKIIIYIIVLFLTIFEFIRFLKNFTKRKK
jgi:hypothetical protein